MRFAFPLFTILLFVLAAAWSMSGESRTHAQETVGITIGDLWFCAPAFSNGVCETEVAAGDTVSWEHAGGLPHTVAQCDAGFATCPPSGGFDSGFLNAGETFAVSFDTPGTFQYRCEVHPDAMRGQITVLAVQEPTATPSPEGEATPTPATAGTPTPAAPPTTGGPPSSGASATATAAVAFVAAMLMLAAAAAFMRRAVR